MYLVSVCIGRRVPCQYCPLRVSSHHIPCCPAFPLPAFRSWEAHLERTKMVMSAWFLLRLCSVFCGIDLWLFQSLWPDCAFITHIPMNSGNYRISWVMTSILRGNCILLQAWCSTHFLLFSTFVSWLVHWKHGHFFFFFTVLIHSAGLKRRSEGQRLYLLSSLEEKKITHYTFFLLLPQFSFSSLGHVYCTENPCRHGILLDSVGAFISTWPHGDKLSMGQSICFQ